jgi:hypothetical protein
MKLIGPEPTFEQHLWHRVRNFAGETIVVDMWGHTVSAERMREFDESHAQWLKESKIKPQELGRFLVHDSTGDGCFVDRFGRVLPDEEPI